MNYTIDYDKIITTNYRELIDDLDYIDVLGLSEKERILFNNYYESEKKRFLASFAHERVYINAKYKDLSKVEKALLSANINYSNEQYLRVIKANNISYNQLDNYIKLVNYIKNKKELGKLSEKDYLYEQKLDLINRKFVKMFSKYQGNTNINMIINKTNELLSYYRNLLIEETYRTDFTILRRG